jgi:tRNA nucleotidyltransferase (CCA-adding enzyme)
VTTHRVDGEYLDSRRPESVSFTRRLEEDLSRRDFTVNAMAWHPTIGLVDLFGGCSDLEKGVIRAVGEPEKRFSEDALRILRAFRFSAQLNFEIEPRTLAGAASCREGLAHISAERIFAEISRLLEAPAAVRGLRALLDAGCEKTVFPHTVLQVNELERLEALPAQAAVRLAFLLRECTASEATELCRCWKTSNVFADQVKVLLQALAQPTPDSLYAARRYVCGYWAGWQGALAIRAALGEDVSAAMEMCKTVSKNGTAIEIKRLAVNGKELQDALGVIPARTGALLARLQDLCWQEPTRNKKPTLLALAERIVKEEGGFAK